MQKNKPAGSQPARSANWEQIKNEYLMGTSQRALARKYNVGVSTICSRAKKENWQALSEQINEETERKIVQKVSNVQSRSASNIARTVELLTTKLMKAAEKVKDDDTRRMKEITSALKDLKDIGAYRSELDKAEQQARIRKLEQEIEQANTIDTECRIVVEGADEYAV